jgi:hypothetical protein
MIYREDRVGHGGILQLSQDQKQWQPLYLKVQEWKTVYYVDLRKLLWSLQ